MRHVQEHILFFDCLRSVETDSNDTLHKITKHSYDSSKKWNKISPQLIAVRDISDALLLNESDEYFAINSERATDAHETNDSVPVPHTNANNMLHEK